MPTVASVHDAVSEYADKVLSNKIVTCDWIKRAAERHFNDLEHAENRGYWFDVDEAQYVFDYFECLKLWEGKWAGQDFKLELWQKFKIGSLFGWRSIDTGLRRFTTAYWEEGRKNAKSTIVAGIGVYMLDGDNESGAQVYAAATKKEQAKIIFNCAKNLVNSSPSLRDCIQVYKHNLSVLETFSKFEPLASDSKKADGFSVSCGLIDELHEHPDGGMIDVLETGTGAREQPLIVMITTAGQDKTSVCYEQHEYSKAILKGKIEDDTYFPLIFTLDEGCPKGCNKRHRHKKPDDWRDPKVWIKANPNLGVSQFEDDLLRKMKKARHILRQQTAFRRKHCNEWVGSDNKWLDVEAWDACNKPFNPDLLEGKGCILALDLSSKLDLNALVAVFPPDDDSPLYKILAWFWIPGNNVDEKVKKEKAPYDVWIREGWIETTDGNIVDYSAIQNKIRALDKKYRIMEIGFDPWNATETAIKLENEGFEMVEVRQGAKTLSEPMKTIEALVVDKKLAHNSNPVLSWNIDNTVIREDPNGNIAPNKKLSRKKIDGATAFISAMARVMGQDDFGSVYDDRGLTVLKPKGN